MSCGAALALTCPSCGTPAAEGARFCMSCGTPLAADLRQAAEPVAEPAPAADELHGLDERRTATILFADLSGYTAIAETLDPEALKRLLAGVLARLGEEVDRFG